MQVTSNRTFCFSGANNRPSAGTATFSDGKTYDWMVHALDGTIQFYAERRQPGYRDSVVFRSAKRAAALAAALEI